LLFFPPSLVSCRSLLCLFATGRCWDKITFIANL
jgi:hypothetical protein